MADVKFVCSDLEDPRLFDVMVDEKYLTTVTRTFDKELRRVHIYIRETRKDEIHENELYEKLSYVFFMTIKGKWWFDLLNAYADFFQFLFKKYQYNICVHYSSIRLEMTGEDFNELNRYSLKVKIEEWLDKIISEMTQNYELKTILPIYEKGVGVLMSLGINDAKFVIESWNSYQFTAKISSEYGEFYALVVLNALMKKNKVVKDSLNAMCQYCGNQGGTIETDTYGEVFKVSGNEELDIKYKV